MAEPEKIWVRSLRHHTYWNIPREVDTYYQVDTLQDAETLENLIPPMAVREGPPAKAKRPPADPTNPAQPVQTQVAALTEPAPAPPARRAAIMTTADLPKPAAPTHVVPDLLKPPSR